MKEKSQPSERDDEAPNVSAESASTAPRMLHPRLLAGVALCLAIYFINDWRPWEPRYHGAPLSHWLETLKSADHGDRASAILLETGPPAVPGLARALLDKPSAFDRRYASFHAKLPTSISEFLPAPETGFMRGSVLAASTLASMGPAAKPALPQLRAILAGPIHPARQSVIHCFGAIMPEDRESIVTMANAWAAAPAPGRDDFYTLLDIIFSRSPEAIDHAAPIIIETLKDEWTLSSTNSRFHNQLIMSLRRLSPENPNTPAAIEILSKYAGPKFELQGPPAQIVLWKLAPQRIRPGERAEVLVKYIASADPWMRFHACTCLLHLVGTPDAPPIARALVEIVRRDENTAEEAIIALAYLEADAEPAVPWLSELASKKGGRYRLLAAATLWAITQDTETIVPLLIESLDSPEGPHPDSRRIGAAMTLSEIGAPAAAALPHLRRHPETDDDGLQFEIAVALWKIDGDATPLISILERSFAAFQNVDFSEKIESSRRRFPQMKSPRCDCWRA
jgi:HEAT repeat protein